MVGQGSTPWTIICFVTVSTVLTIWYGLILSDKRIEVVPMKKTLSIIIATLQVVGAIGASYLAGTLPASVYVFYE